MLSWTVICALRSLSGCVGLSAVTRPKRHHVVGPSVVNMVEHNNSSRMMMLRGGLTQEQLFMCVKIDAGSRPMSREMMDPILHMGNESTALVHGRGCVDLRLNIVNDNIG
ncbi:hypothetical protein Tco_0441811 [Tanacetum coccineum]